MKRFLVSRFIITTRFDFCSFHSKIDRVFRFSRKEREKVQTIATATLALGIAFFLLLGANAFEVPGTIRYQDVLVSQVHNTNFLACYLAKDTKMKIINTWGHRDEIRAIEGVANGCRGYVNRDQIEVFWIRSTGRWGRDIPVFKTMRDYFNARDRNIFEHVVCRLEPPEIVDFKPYRNWGLGLDID